MREAGREIGTYFVGGVMARDDRVTKRDTVAVIAGKKQAGDTLFGFSHESFETSITYVVLRNGVAKKSAVNEGRLSDNSEQRAQIVKGHIYQCLGVGISNARGARAEELTFD